MTTATDDHGPAVPRLRGSGLPLLLFASGVLFSYRGLIGLAPYHPTPTDVPGLEGALFGPVPSSPGFVLIVFLWKLAEQHQAIRTALRDRGAPWAAAMPLALSAALYGWATHTGADELLLPSFSLLLLSAGLAAGSWRGADSLIAPGLIVLFAVPIPAALLNQAMWDLQLATAALATSIADLWVSTARSGDLIFYNQRIFQVIEACAGLATMSTLTLTSFIIPASIRRRRIHSILLVVSAPLVSFAINVARVLTIMTNPLSRLSSVHTTQGIVMLVVGILILVGVDHVLGRIFGAARPIRPVEAQGNREPLVAIAAIPFLFGIIGLMIPRFSGDEIRHPSFRSLRSLPELQGQVLEVDADFLGTVALTQSAHTRYRVEGSAVDVFLGVNNRRFRHGSAISPKTELLDSGYVVEERGVAEHPASGRVVTELVVRPPPHLPPEERERLLVHHYALGAGSTAYETGRALLALDEGAWRRTDRQIVIRLATPVGDTERERTAAEARIRQIAVLIEAHLANERITQ